MSLSQKAIDEFKVIYKDQNAGKELTEAEASEAANNLVGLYNILFEATQQEVVRKRRLKKEPDGFPVDSHYSCLVCGNQIGPETGWYNQYGNKCFPCTKAVKEGVVPTFVCEHSDSFYRMWQLTHYFGIKTPTAKKLIREGKLKPRVITNENGTVHDYIFLKKENPELIRRYNPIRKSYDRHRKKMSKIWVREETKKLRAEFLKTKQKLAKKRVQSY